MESLTIVGLPLSKNSATEEFLNFISSDRPIILFSSVWFDSTSNDYITAKIGYELLFENGFKIVQNIFVENLDTKKILLGFPLWVAGGGLRKDPTDVANFIIEIYKKLKEDFPNYKIAYITPGSPFLYDLAVEKIINSGNNIKIIDTKSSAQLCYEHLLKYDHRIPKYPLNIVLKNPNRVDLKENYINMIGCLGAIYNFNSNLLLPQLSESDLIFTISIGDNTLVKEHTIYELKKMFRNKDTRLNFSILSIIKSTV